MTFSIEFDYRFDTDGFFDATARAALEEAGRIWENLIQDEFPNFSAGQTLNVQNPQSGQFQQVTINQEIDDLLIFVGTRNLGGALGSAGPTAPAPGDENQLRVSGDFRGQGPTTDFEPSSGTLTFDPLANWNFNIAGPVEGQPDFITVALHEIGHILGFSTSPTFDAFVSGGRFGGPNALAANGGQSIPLTADGHVEEGFMNDSVLLDPISTSGVRTLPSNIDLAILADIGYEIDGFTAQGSSFEIATNQGETIFGRDIADAINGLGGDDTIQGGGGDDRLQGGAGSNVIFGDEGTDRFYFSPGDGRTQISDFDFRNETIVVDPAFGFTSVAEVLDLISSPFANVREVEFGGGTSASIFENGTGSQLSAANIEFGTLVDSNPTEGNDVLTGTGGADVLDGRGGNDTISGLGGNDLLIGGRGNDDLNGGAGRDAVRYDAAREGFTIQENPNGTVTVTSATDGTDTLSSIEQIDFSNGSLVFDITDALPITFADGGILDNYAYPLYSAALNRTPDAAGLEFWSDFANTDAIQNIAFDASLGQSSEVNGQVRLAAEFVTSPEFNTPDTATNAGFVTKLYSNFLGTSNPDQAGFEFWSGVYEDRLNDEIDSGRLPDGVTIFDGTSNQLVDVTTEQWAKAWMLRDFASHPDIFDRIEDDVTAGLFVSDVDLM